MPHSLYASARLIQDSSVLDVFLTTDVEVWCESWEDLDATFPRAFQRYIYGKTPDGDYGLPFQIRLLEDHGLNGVFFVEPLFACRFGLAPLEEIVGLLSGSHQEIQLHLHTEWVDEATSPLLPGLHGKRQFMRDFDLQEQRILIAAGLELMRRAGCGRINAFRAGSFGFNGNTLEALAGNEIQFDSSYNANLLGLNSGMMPGIIVTEPIEYRGVYEYPMTVFADGTGRLRHTQLGACSSRELEGVLWKAFDQHRLAVVILSHNFELLNRGLNRPDRVVVQRMRRLCRFLEKNRDCFRVRGFNDLKPLIAGRQRQVLSSPVWKTIIRMSEQLYRLRFR